MLNKKVKFIDENISGKIVKVNKNGTIIVLSDDGFEYTTSLKKVVFCNETEIEKYKKTLNNFDKELISNENNFSKVRKKNNEIIIDLHIENVIKKCHNNKYNKYFKRDELNIQLDYFVDELHKAMNKGVKKVYFIHGKGKGVLKEEIRKILRSYTNIKFCDAPYKKFGEGATEVHIL